MLKVICIKKHATVYQAMFKLNIQIELIRITFYIQYSQRWVSKQVSGVICSFSEKLLPPPKSELKLLIILG